MLRTTTQPRTAEVTAAASTALALLDRSMTASPATHSWRRHPLLPIFTATNASPAVRQHLRERLDFSAEYLHSAALWPIARISTSRAAMHLLPAETIELTARIPDPSQICLQIGGRRVRAFDLDRQISSLVDVAGEGRTSSISAEIEARHVGDKLFAPLLDSDSHRGWLVEEMVPGRSVARQPPWIDRNRIHRQVLARLGEWQACGERSIDAGDIASRLVFEIGQSVAALQARGGQASALSEVVRAAERSADRIASSGDRVRLVPSHGDLQAGNILWDRRKKSATLVDLEHYGYRSDLYDPFVLLLGLRWSGRRSVSERIHSLTDPDHQAWSAISEAMPGNRPERDEVMCRLLLIGLEDALWQTNNLLGQQPASAAKLARLLPLSLQNTSGE